MFFFQRSLKSKRAKYTILKPPWAAQNGDMGRMWPAGRTLGSSAYIESHLTAAFQTI